VEKAIAVDQTPITISIVKGGIVSLVMETRTVIEIKERFKIDVDGCEEAKAYLRSIGKGSLADDWRYDGYTIIQVANKLYDDGAHNEQQQKEDNTEK
jgi:hypothetical protein